MDYPFEQLNPERFQEFAQALIVREFPNTQCFPVGQPDGGRDAVMYYPFEGREFVVFQVKFVRDPRAIDDPRRWMLDIIADEAPKLSRLLPKGARQYVLITNVKGSAHLDAGTIDKASQALAENISVPAQCWWRDDISRRLDDAWNLKWIYPELMTGPDLMRAVIATSSSDGRDRRDAAIRALIAHQYRVDSEVRFRQVELQNGLLDLFVDVPIGPPQSGRTRKDLQRVQRLYEYILHTTPRGNLDQLAPERDRPVVGGATFLLHPIVQESMREVVIEGAPGQGKSTITQYVCQVHRMRLLEDHAALDALPNEHRAAPRRLPIRIDLRDLAAWLSGRNPFVANDGESTPAQRNLETFIASLIHYQSGGIDFDVSDLHAIGRNASLLVVFDGLDEVADIARRRDVVNEILAGVHRLSANCTALQVVVTSRPAAFANSPGMPADKFVYFQLGAVGKSHIAEYTDKWIRARHLSQKEGAEVRQILKEKLDQPHLRDLARNPMQLTILLSLIHTRGSSLPDKRTSLYDSYIDLFFSREAEKSSVVRKHRDLLINIHRYLAWLLHTAAERGDNTGAIEERRLRDVVREYLSHEGHDPALVNELFAGMVERVVALVSRVEGMFEFEVQPLREYFAARYLYETAPYSPPGDPRRGTKPDRFDAIARDFYWFNVTRFYAGCYSKGELPSLIDRLSELASDVSFALTSHPPLLAATLLADYVFTQHPKSVKQVVRIILGGLGLRYVLTSAKRQVDMIHPLALPTECGRVELLSHAVALLTKSVPRDFALDLIDLIRANASAEEIYTRWSDVMNTDVDQTIWLDYGRHLGVLHLVPLQLLQGYASSGDGHKRRQIILQSRIFRFFNTSAAEVERAVDLIMNGDVSYGLQRRVTHILDSLGVAVNPLRYAAPRYNVSPHIPMRDAWKRLRSATDFCLSDELSSPVVVKCREFLSVVSETGERSVGEWHTSLQPWSAVVEAGRKAFGDVLAMTILANTAAGIRSASETSAEAKQLFDRSAPLCNRVRYARLRAGQAEWWSRQFDAVSHHEDRELALLTALRWCSAATLIRLQPRLDDHVSAMSDLQWSRMFSALRRCVEGPHREHLAGLPRGAGEFNMPSASPRLAALLWLRMKSEVLFQARIAPYNGREVEIAELQQEWATDHLVAGKIDWEVALPLIAGAYARGAVTMHYAASLFARRGQEMPIALAREVVTRAEQYPAYVVASAQEACRALVAQSIIPVGQVAENQRWFS